MSGKPTSKVVAPTVIPNEDFLAMTVPELVEALAKHIKKSKGSEAGLTCDLTAPSGKYTFSAALVKVRK